MNQADACAVKAGARKEALDAAIILTVLYWGERAQTPSPTATCMLAGSVLSRPAAQTQSRFDLKRAGGANAEQIRLDTGDDNAPGLARQPSTFHPIHS